MVLLRIGTFSPRLLAGAVLLGAACLPVLAVGGGAEKTSAADPQGLELFERRIRALLVNRCYSCHSAQAETPAGGLRLDSREALLKGGSRGAVIAPGNPEGSLLLRALRQEEGVPRMPPTGRLSPGDLGYFADWIRRGAPWPGEAPRPAIAPTPAAARGHWAFRPVRPVAPPAVRNGNWVRNPVDAFLLAKLEARGLRPAPEASRETLLRRVTLDLTGLLPTPEDRAAFLSDTSPQAWEKVVERLLASPRYGERWGRRWLDVARYADSNGLDENLAYAHAWRYRDYVIEAFNRDLPYDQFLSEQIAGDLLPGEPARQQQRLVATGFLSLGPKMLAEDDPVKMELDIIDEQLDTIGKAALGMTLGCARCHDHKFDPISQADYYALAGILKSTRTMENFRVVAVWHENLLGTPEERTRFEAAERLLQEARAAVDRLLKEGRDALVRRERERSGEYVLASADLLRAGGAAALAPTLGTAARGERPGLRLLEAEEYARGNLQRDRSTYGLGIGVLVNQGEYPNLAEYEVEFPEAGWVQVDLRLAAAESRPIELWLNGSLVKRSAAAGVTGSWTPESQRWFAEGIFRFVAGRNLIRLVRPTGPFPQVDALALTRRGEGNGAAAPATLESIAAERGLVPEFLNAWKERLANPGRTALLAEWRRLADQARSSEDRQRVGSAISGQVREVLSAWTALLREKPGAERLADPGQEAIRGLVLEGEGVFRAPGQPEPYFLPVEKQALSAARAQVTVREKAVPDLPRAVGVTEGAPTDLRIHLRGNYLTLGNVSPRRFPTAIPVVGVAPVPAKSSGRLELARWLTAAENPLTARVMVNRIWQGHFGVGLVGSADNFGRLGDAPTHPELLDWLADRFRRDWSVKNLHRLLLHSAAYRMSTRYSPTAAAGDPDNQWLWRFRRRRMDAEELRDNLLLVSGSLDLTMGGTLLPLKNREYLTSTANRDTTDYNAPRRAVYLPVVRSSLYDLFTAFDFGDPSVVNGQRTATTVAPQALFMMNGKLPLRESRRLAERLLARTDLDDAGRVREVFLRVYGRLPRVGEGERLLEFAAGTEARLAATVPQSDERRTRAWQSLVRVVLSANEFLYVE